MAKRAGLMRVSGDGGGPSPGVPCSWKLVAIAHGAILTAGLPTELLLLGVVR
jgi:hypothetical protein